jgi:hypothetical protein
MCRYDPSQAILQSIVLFSIFDDIDKILVVVLHSIIALNIIHLDVHNTVAGLGYMVKLF